MSTSPWNNQDTEQRCQKDVAFLIKTSAQRGFTIPDHLFANLYSQTGYRFWIIPSLLQ